MSSRADEWARVKEVFDQARPLPPADRRAFVSTACASEPGVRAHVERLLAAHQLTSGFLDGPAVLSGEGEIVESLDGQEIGGYELTAFLGAGGMGEVYQAYDRKLDRPVAVKLLPVRLTKDADWLRRFRAEARAASSLNHPHILVVHDFGDFRGRPFMVTEFVEGQTLRERITTGPIAVRDAVGFTIQIASALAASHARGIVHRDIKPENLMVRPDGYIKVLDFGLARQLAGQQAGTLTATEPGTLVGTLRYMSPEQTRGEPAHASSDVFSLGLVLYETITGRHAFHADSTIGVLHNIQSGAVGASGAGQEVDDLLATMLHKNPSLRPPAADVVTRLTGVATRAPSAGFVPRRGTSVGRERERADLRAAFEAADAGSGQFVSVAGEPGIGKSTLVDDFLSEIASPAWIGRGRCSERLAGAEAHLPFLEALDSLVKRDPAVATTIKNVAPSWYVHIGPMSEEESSAARLLAETKSGSAERLMREMAALVHELGRARPVVLFLDDLQWADVSTVDLLGFLAPKLAHLRCLVVITYRPTDLTLSKHPFLRLKADLSAHGVLRDVPIALLTERDVTEYVSAQLPDAPREVAGLIYRKTEGNPLFMVDLVRFLRERTVTDAWSSEIEQNIPESLRGMIARNLERLDEGERQLLSVAAVQGFEFDSAIIAGVLERDPADVEEALQSMDRVHGLVQLQREQELPNRLFSLRYQFVHVLYQSALYSSIAPSRKAAWSSKLAGQLEAAYADRTRTVAAELALLYQMARDPWRASEHFLAAAEVASSRFATHEAVAFARRGLACLTGMAASPDVERRELALQKASILPIAALEGFGSATAERVSRRIVELSERLNDHGSLFTAIDAVLFVHMVRGECVEAARIADRQLSVGRQSGSDDQQMNAHMWAAIARHHLGEQLIAREHADACIRMGNAFNQGRRLISIFDSVVGALAESSRILWMLGETRESLSRAARGVALAREIRHPDSLSFALLFQGWMHGYRENWDACLESTAEGIALGAEHGLAQTTAWHRCVRGWALAHAGQAADGIAELHGGIEDSVRILGQVAMTNFVAMLAEVLIIRGEQTRALHEIQRILVVNETHRDDYFNAELNRLAAECLLALDEPDEAEAALERAIAIARAQHARTFELRAATVLGRLWAGRNEQGRAHDRLQDILGGLHDPEDVPDVRRARACLKEWNPTA
jgi:serine/threonine protein kinase/predicted ATPase